VVLATALSGCVSTPGWLAASGPTRVKVSSGASDIQASIQVFTVSDAVARRVIEAGGHGQFSDTFGDKPPTGFVVGTGDTLVVSVWEAPPDDRLFTVNIGMRYELETSRNERYDRLSWFNPGVTNPVGAQVGLPNLRGGLEFANVGGNGRRQKTLDPKNFGPRFGLAYSVTPTTVVRAGYGLADAIAQVVELGATDPGAALHVHLRDEWRMQRINALDAFIIHDAADGKRLVDSAALAHDDGAGKHLDALLVAFNDARVNIDGIADVELRNILLEMRCLDGFHNGVGHGGLT